MIAKLSKKEPVAGMGRILVMDDEEPVRAVVGEMLKAVGYEYELAKNGTKPLSSISGR